MKREFEEISDFKYGQDDSPEHLLRMVEIAKTKITSAEIRIVEKRIQFKFTDYWYLMCEHFKCKSHCAVCKLFCPHFFQKELCEKCKPPAEVVKYEQPKGVVYDPNAVRAEMTKRMKKSFGYKRNPNRIKEPDYIKSAKKLEYLLQNGYKDIRRRGKTCPHCNRICVEFERAERTVINTISHTETRFVKNANLTIGWGSPCIECNKKKAEAWHNLPENFNSDVALRTLKRHIGGNVTSLTQDVIFIRQRDNDRCRACGVDVIPALKSGWRQFSLNDMYPDRRLIEKTASIDDIVICCLACNSYQNKLPWNMFLMILSQTAKTNFVKQIITSDSDYVDTLTRKEIKWINRYKVKSQCPQDIRNAVINRDKNICQLTGIQVIFESNHWNTASYDRKDSKLPYTLENTQLVTKHANYVKTKSITKEEFDGWLQHIRTKFKPQ